MSRLTPEERAIRNRITKRHSRVRETLVRWLLDRSAQATSSDARIHFQELTELVEALRQRKSS